MNLVKTLGKVAVGVMVARGVGKMMGGGQAAGSSQAAGGGLGGLLGGLLSGGAGSAAGGGLAGMLGSVLSGSGGGGGLGGLLGSLAGGGAAAGGLGGLLNSALAGNAPEQVSDNDNAQAELLLRAMINAAKCDGDIDESEQQKLLEHLGDVSEEEASFVRHEMAQPLDVEAFIRSVPQDMGPQVYLMSLLAIDLDAQAEARYLDALAQGFGIDHATANAIHEKVGVPTLYR